MLSLGNLSFFKYRQLLEFLIIPNVYKTTAATTKQTPCVCVYLFNSHMKEQIRIFVEYSSFSFYVLSLFHQHAPSLAFVLPGSAIVPWLRSRVQRSNWRQSQDHCRSILTCCKHHLSSNKTNSAQTLWKANRNKGYVQTVYVSRISKPVNT